jgi:glycosyltransferase involved in cell wall biosynthesis
MTSQKDNPPVSPQGVGLGSVPRELREHPSLPKISIVTPSYNQGQFIEETICSILSQDYPRLEYIIMDGGSTDQTVEIIRKYADRITFWVSEKDRGQSHAINKGIARCTGDIFNWVNSDDTLKPGALWKVAETWLQTSDCVISGAIEILEGHKPAGLVRPSDLTLRNFIRFWEAKNFVWGQQSTFLPLQKLRAIGGVREDLHYSMDYNMMVNLLAAGCEVKYVEAILAQARFHPASKTVGSTEDFRLECVPALRAIKNLPVKVEDWEWDAQQARRLVDVARHAWRRGGYIRALNFLRRALTTSPRGTVQEMSNRWSARLARSAGQT